MEDTPSDVPHLFYSPTFFHYLVQSIIGKSGSEGLLIKTLGCEKPL